MIILLDPLSLFGPHSTRASCWDAYFELVNPITVLPESTRSEGISIAFMLCAEIFLLGPPEKPASLYERVGMDLLQRRGRQLPKVK